MSWDERTIERQDQKGPSTFFSASLRLCVCAVGISLVFHGVAAAELATHGMVVSEHALASAAGVEILQKGGNAIDAAAATALAVGVTNPTSCGIGGGGFLLAYFPGTQRAVALDYRERAPAAATREMFIRDGKADPALSRSGGLAIAVPGEVAGLTHAVRRYGRLPFATVIAPAVRLARDGFPIGAHLAESIAHNRDVIQTFPALAAVLLHPDGSPRAAGEPLKQPALAHTLENIAEQGPDAFYRGAVAADIVDATRTAGGILTVEDLAQYRPTARTPLRGGYRGHEVLTMPPPSSGGGVLLEILNIIARDDLVALGHNSPTTLHLLVEAMKHAFADRAEVYGDPDFVSVPLPRLLSLRYATAVRDSISTRTTFDRDFYGAAEPSRDAGTSHLSVIDADGNAVAVTTTVNTAFGSMVLAPQSGVILNNEMDDFAAQPGVPNVFGLIGAAANAVAPHKRPLSSMTPTIVLDHNRAMLIAGGSGGPVIITATLQTLLNVVDFDFDVNAAVAASRVHDQWVPEVLAVEPGIDVMTRTALERLGHHVREVPNLAAVQAVRVTAGGYTGAADPRKGGAAQGW
ncbi:MAG: gamma-glutamyltransferase [Deltaproteobacteria bacterium]|nr:gamma-glutamyltransferase [Deltaproteobacteria bacterium]MBI3388051.1 gamma-glutamyltransferase [Deltaproteobacteria bacterium]